MKFLTLDSSNDLKLHLEQGRLLPQYILFFFFIFLFFLLAFYSDTIVIKKIN